MQFVIATFFGIDLLLSLYAVVAFVIIGILLAAFILFTKAKFVTSEECEICINDNPKLTKCVAGGGTLLTALMSQGVSIPSPCGGKATCLQCRVQIKEGADPPVETDRSTFTKKELNEGWRLSCQSKLKHNLKIYVDESCLDIKKSKRRFLAIKMLRRLLKNWLLRFRKRLITVQVTICNFTFPLLRQIQKSGNRQWSLSTLRILKNIICSG